MPPSIDAAMTAIVKVPRREVTTKMTKPKVEKMETADFNLFVESYLECAAWSTANIDGNGNSDESLEGYEYAPEAIEQAKRDCADFIKQADMLLENIDAGQAGHDFWLTREHHGVGFWDRGLGQIGDDLTKLAHSFGGGNLYLGDDKLLYFG